MDDGYFWGCNLFCFSVAEWLMKRWNWEVERKHICYLWLESSLEFQCFLNAQDKICHAHSAVDYLWFSACFPFVLVSRDGPFLEIGLVFSVQHLERSERETGFCTLLQSNRELLVGFVKRKNTVSKKCSLETFQSAVPEKQCWQLHKLVSLPRTACLPTLPSCLPAKASDLCSWIIVAMKRGGLSFLIVSFSHQQNLSLLGKAMIHYFSQKWGQCTFGSAKHYRVPFFQCYVIFCSWNAAYAFFILIKWD